MKKIIALILVLTTIFLVSCTKSQDTESQTEVTQETTFGRTTQIGDYITFGSYEQDNDASNGKEPIEWLVLSKTDSELLVISKYVLDSKPFDVEYDTSAWEKCSLRSWLNNDFFNEAFSSEEQARICEDYLIAELSPYADEEIYDKYPKLDIGNNTYDKIYLLSASQVESLFDSDLSMRCAPTEYALAQGSKIEDNSRHYTSWMVRTSTGAFCSLVTVMATGGLNYLGGYNNIRPAMRISY